ncbi:MAG: hypothetical protein Q9186_003435 [Xanthomendoza sp. 1 TL-2023]
MIVQWQSHHSPNLANNIVPPDGKSPSQVTPSTLSLAFRTPNLPTTLKRCRSQTDVEGENSIDVQRKKRRLRIDLVTSRLSQPYATPATHIISIRRAQRLGPWARPRFRVRSPLRRAAILNAIRIREMTAKHLGHKEVNLLTGLRSEQESDHTEINLVTKGIRTPRDPSPHGSPPEHHTPPMPSPLGPSNYDAFDEEEEDFDEGDTGTDDEGDSVYSNFNDLDCSDPNIEDYDTLCPFGGVIEEYDRPWKFDKTGDDGQVDMEKARSTVRLPLLHKV